MDLTGGITVALQDGPDSPRRDISRPATRAQGLLFDGQQVHRNPMRSPQGCPTSAQMFDHAEDRRPSLWHKIEVRFGRILDNFDGDGPNFERLLNSRKSHRRRVEELREKWRKLRSVQFRDIRGCREDVRSEIRRLELICRSLNYEILVSEKKAEKSFLDCEKKSVDNHRKENYLGQQLEGARNEILSLNSDRLASEKEAEKVLEDCKKNLEENHRREVYLGQQLEAARNEIRELEIRLHRKFVAMEENIRWMHDDEMKSVNRNLEELRKISHGLKSEYAADQHSVSCGSYETATPVLLHKAFIKTKLAVNNFQKSLVSAKYSTDDLRGVVKLVYDGFFARPHHFGFAIKAAVYDVLFESFENECFNTSSGGCSRGASRFLDPNLRATKFYEYYQRTSEGLTDIVDIQDPQFEQFCQMKVSSLWGVLNPSTESPKTCAQATCVKDFADRQLEASFRAALKSVWLLHKLAFSFEPPAYIVRPERDGDVDPNYMEPVVSLEDNEAFLPKVGFTIAPGLRLRKTVLRSEVYLKGSSTC